MTQAKSGDTVKIHYNGTLEDGTVFDTSSERGPIEFTIGQGRVIPGVEAAIMGMAEGEQKTVTLQPEDAYGPHRDDLIVRVSRNEMPPEIEPQVGLRLQASSQDGATTEVTITDVQEDEITLDANHPLAGKPLNFDITLVEIAS